MMQMTRGRRLGWLVACFGVFMLMSLAGGCDCGKPPGLDGVLPEGSVDVVPSDASPDAPPTTCTQTCDCPQGQDCLNGACVVPTIPVYCCDRDNCPQGVSCVDSTGGASTCGVRKACQHPCDCPQRNSCVDGFCTATDTPTFCCEKSGCEPGKACVSLRGGNKTCGGEGQPCASTCDCNSGLACINGQCTKSNQPVYCCDSTNCPKGAACENKRGAKGVCGQIVKCNSTCDCPTGQACTNFQCEATPVPVYCCDNAAQCPAGQLCDTKSGQRQKCAAQNECKAHCDCPQGLFCERGQCAKGPSPVYCCEKPGCAAGNACYKPDGSVGSCSSPPCASSADCGKPSCRQQGTQCSEVTPICGRGVCSSNVKTAAGRCNPATGKCEGVTACRTHCDCPQGNACRNGQCVVGAGTYCCSKPGCPAGRACFNVNGTPGTCNAQPQCKSNSDCPPDRCRTSGTGCILFKTACSDAGTCISSNGAFQPDSTCRIVNGVGSCVSRTCRSNTDCGKASCRDARGNCIQTVPVCSGGRCTQQSVFVQSATCQSSTGACLPTGQPCKSACDCTQGQACANGRCQNTPTPTYCCSNSGCPSGSACTNRDGSNGTCAKPPQCASDLNCKASGCQQIGPFCQDTSETCVNGTCQQKAVSPTPGTCDTRTGQCKAATTCRTHCDCPQGQGCQRGPNGIGTCIQGPTPIYCCSKAGCPSKQTCFQSTGQQGTCPIVCKTPCDCAAGQDCVGTKCVNGPSPIYCCDNTTQCPSGAACKNKAGQSGTCPTAPRKCTNNCDCVQGEGCVNGLCAKTPTPTYCCDSPGCKSGAACKNKLGQTGTCPIPCKTHCDCPQGRSCTNGFCNATVNGAYCCTKPGCPSRFGCFRPDGRRDRCPTQTCTSPCDCSQGEDCRNGTCTRVNPPVYCCSGANCPAGQACKDKTNKWGTCQSQPACKSACDCPQGRDCYNGQCIQVFPAVYCCTKVGCPSGQACFDNTNKPGTCPGSQCTSACDCPRQGQACVRGRCVFTNPRIYCCSKASCPAGNSCEDTKGNAGTCPGNKCTTPCDCNQGEDCRNGTCTRVSPPVYCCSKPGCFRGRTCVNSNGSSGTCPSTP